MKNVFISSKKLFSFSIYSNFCISALPLFLLVSHCFRCWSNINFIVCGIINWLNKNLIIHFVWYLGEEKRYDIGTLHVDRVLKKKHFYGKIMQKNVHHKLVPDPLLILVNNPKQPLHARNSFKSKMFRNRIIKNPLKSQFYFFFLTQSLFMDKVIKNKTLQVEK